MCYSWGESAKLTLKAPAGNLTVLPDRRKYRLHILGASKEITVKVYVDGTQAAGVCCTYDEETGIATAEIPYIETGRCAEVLMEHCKFHDNRMAGGSISGAWRPAAGGWGAARRSSVAACRRRLG